MWSAPSHSHALLQQLKRKLISLSIIENVRYAVDTHNSSHITSRSVCSFSLSLQHKHHVLHFRWCYLFQYLSHYCRHRISVRFNAMNTNAHQREMTWSREQNSDPNWSAHQSQSQSAPFFVRLSSSTMDDFYCPKTFHCANADLQSFSLQTLVFFKSFSRCKLFSLVNWFDVLLG